MDYLEIFSFLIRINIKEIPPKMHTISELVGK